MSSVNRKSHSYPAPATEQNTNAIAGPVDLKQKEKDVNNKLQLYGIFEGMCPRAMALARQRFWCRTRNVNSD
jgi:hypothetical protein